ncbi:hypothetical protein FXV83_16585 [Bradyrhizobium hipponense]|uniref:Uncharacterized protein n=1 Tax=Bradyrhizobium hipponense TaxID=2605638 RepID=A0A5S4YN39_9BRAD|nr:hypothetical protein [Bradyrhizobium hipponense]TYO65548.1 hypothetical protein FXV83_16585 [Bradyrhizobium hipponense]
MDNLTNKAAVLWAAVQLRWAQARELAATKGKAILAALVVLTVFGFAFHLGGKGKPELKAEVVELKQQLADERSKPAPQPEIPVWQCNGPKETRHPQCPDEGAADRADQLAGQHAESEAAKAKLEKKVKDYETQLARRPAKAGTFTLSPADARSLQNIR